MANIRTTELDELYAQLRLSGGVASRPLSGRTVRICHTVMRQSLDQARKWGVIARNPARDATPPSAGHSEVSPRSMGQVGDLLAAAFDEDSDFGVYLWLLATSGCRRGEGCALRWKDVSWDTGELLIRRNIAHVGRDKATTLNIYSHTLPATDALAAETVSRLIRPTDALVQRKRWLSGDLGEARLAAAVDDLVDLPIERQPMTSLIQRAQELRSNVTPYDAVYVALAVALNCVLLSADRRLASAPGMRADVQIVQAGSQ